MKALGTRKFYGQIGLVLSVILFWNLSWASSKFHLQDTTSLKNRKQISPTQIKNDPVDSLTCDHVRPYFTNLRPWDKKREVELFPTIRFTANDDDQHKDDDPSGIDTSTVFITIKVHPNGPRIIKARPHLVRFVDGFFKIDYDFTLPQQLNYDDTVWVKLEANDLSRNKNYGSRQYRFYIKKDPFPPELKVIQPVPFSGDVSIATPLVFFASDNKNMLDQNSAQLVINNETIPWDKLQFISTGSGDTIKFQPDTAFAYNARIDVSLKIADVQGNWADTTFWFDTKVDTSAPQIEPIRPLPNDTEVLFDTDIVIYFSDDISGNDTSSLVFKVNDMVIPRADYTLIHTQSGDTIKYQPPQYQWNDTANVFLEIADFAHNVANKSYQLFIMHDFDAPLITIITPLADEKCVDDSSVIKIDVDDTKSGIDKSTASLNVNGNDVSGGGLFWNNDTLVYSPATPFLMGEIVEVNFSIADSAGNSADTSYNFVVESLPEIKIARPKPGAAEVAPTTDVAFYVPHTNCGIDTSTVIFIVNGDTVDHKDLIFDVDGIGDSVKYQPSAPFAWGSQVSVGFRVGDFAGNFADTSFFFVTQEDSVSPQITLIDPLPDMTCADDSAEIVIFAEDLIAGIDETSAVLEINSVLIPLSDLEFISVFRGDTIKYKPQQPFAVGDTINIDFSIADSAGNVADTSYSFIIETPPIIKVVRPQPGDFGVLRSADIVLSVAETLCKIDTTSLSFEVNGIVQTDVKITFNGQAYEFQYVPATPFDYGESVNVHFTIADFNGVYADTSYNFGIVPPPDTLKPIIEIVNPLPDEHCADDSSEIILYVKDLDTGIDPLSKELKINNSLIDTNKIIVIENSLGIGDTIKFKQDVAFALGDTVFVEFAISDFASNVADTSYSFQIETMPEIQIIQPQPDEKNVAVNTDVVLEVGFTKCGIDVGSYRFAVNDTLQTMTKVDSASQQYLFRYSPANGFAYDDTVKVSFSIADFAGNWAEITYHFQTAKFDTIDPKIAVITPRVGQTGVDIATNVKVYLFDNESGIDTSSLVLKIDGTPIRHSNLAFTKTPVGFFVDYHPQTAFDFDDSVTVYVYVEDNGNNAADSSYWFTTEAAPEPPPVIKIIKPLPGAINVDVDAEIKIYTYDLEAGIDSSSIVLKVDSAIIAHDSLNFTSTPVGFFVSYKPTNPFNFSAVVNVDFLVKDKANVKADTSYQFTIVPPPVPVPIAPKIQIITPQPMEMDVDDSTNIVINATDLDDGIDTSSVILSLNAMDIPHSALNFQPIKDGVSVIYDPNAPFSYSSKINVQFTVMDLDSHKADTTFYFFTENQPAPPDTIPPKIQIVTPQPDEKGVPLQAPIEIFVWDEETGVDTSTVVLKINNVEIFHQNLEFLNNKNGIGDTIIYRNHPPFAEDGLIDVYCQIADFASIPNKADTSFHFTTTSDTIAPVITVIRPIPGDTVVNDSTDIVLEIRDFESGIDTTNIIFHINGVSVPLAKLQKDSIDAGYQIIYEPDSAFAYESLVEVYFSVSDLSVKKNRSDTSYTFQIEKLQINVVDSSPPLIEAVVPAENTLDVHPATPIIVDIMDLESGVNKDSIKMFVDNVEISHSDITFNGDSSKYTISYTNHPLFTVGSVVNVDITAKDFSENLGRKRYSFSTFSPSNYTAPKIEVVRPKPNAVAPDTTDFVFIVYDNETIVDFNSIELIIDSMKIDIADIQVKHSMTSIKDTIMYLPPLPFAFGEDVDVKLSIRDADPFPHTADTAYSIIIFDPTPPDTIKPIIEICAPLPDERNVSTVAPIVIYTYDDETGVDSSTIKLTVRKSELNNQDYMVKDIQNMGADSVIYAPRIAYPSGQKILVKFHVEDYAGNPADTTFGFFTKKEKIIVRSNPFTPNGDGINDEVEFNFEKLDVAYPVLKIFDLHNQLQREIRVNTGKRRIRWNGNDDRGRPLLPGIYFYILFDGSKPKARGIVAIAK